MSVSNLTNGCKKEICCNGNCRQGRDCPLNRKPAPLALTRCQLIEVQLALTTHVGQLSENYAFRPTKAHQLTLLAANNALDLVRQALA